jgi:hypothetical protein
MVITLEIILSAFISRDCTSFGVNPVEHHDDERKSGKERAQRDQSCVHMTFKALRCRIHERCRRHITVLRMWRD